MSPDDRKKQIADWIALNDTRVSDKKENWKSPQGISRQSKHTGSEAWVGWSDSQTIKTLRKCFNLPKLAEAEYKCLRCTNPYKSQTQGGRRVQFYCYDCQQWQSKQTEWI